MQEMRESTGHEVLRPSLRTDESGIALIYVTVMLPVILGFALLAIDAGRFMTLNSSLQHGADALALAGAAELDGTSNAITRSEEAMQAFVTQNKALFTSSAADIKFADVSRCYLAALPDDDTAIADKDCLSTAAGDIGVSSGKTRFVRVTVTPKTYTTVFPASFLGALTDNVSTRAEAVAGFEAAACNFTPMFMCNPFEPAAAAENDPANVKNPYGIYDYVKNRADRRRLITFKTQDKTWGPGNFGFLAVNGGSGAPALVTQILSDAPSACFKLRDLSTQTGNMESLSAAFNVRFDLYPKGALPGGEKPKDYSPAPNVRKGYIIDPAVKGKPNYCTDQILDTTQTKAKGFGSDTCCLAVDGVSNDRIGNGDWDFDGYWNFNFSASKPVDETGAVFSNTNRPSRYEIYKYEIANDLVKQKKSGSEVGTPQCVTGTTSSVGADRRIIYGAIMNCRAAGINGKTTGLQAVAFGKFFMTNPMSKESITDPATGTVTDKYTLSTELVDIVRPGDGSGVARDMVQLYR